MKYDNLALVEACRNRCGNDLIKLLLNNGADVKCRMSCFSHKTTPLHCFLRSSKVDKSADDIQVVKWLIQWGANLNSRDIYGDTPLHVAVNLKKNTLLKKMILASNTIGFKADLNVTDINGNTVLHSLIKINKSDYAMFGNVGMFRDIMFLLVENG